MMRTLASAKRIKEIKAIPNADLICAYRVDGWWVVDAVGKYRVGDLAIYCEIDSWIPNAIAPFLSKGQEPREYNGVKGERLRTVKLRGQISQGLLIELDRRMSGNLLPTNRRCVSEGDDVSEELGIIKWEAPIPAQLAGEVRGSFPGVIPKTDEERLQNLSDEFLDWKDSGTEWEVTEKLDGSSMTVYVFGEDEGVCSRNLNLKETEGNSLWSVARRENLLEKIRSTGRNLALQGELIGEGIQKNRYKLKGQDFFVYKIYDIDRGCFFNPKERVDFVNQFSIKHVPVVSSSMKLLDDVFKMLESAEGQTLLGSGAEREGLVWKNLTQPETSFKTISNKFLLKGGE